MFQHGQKLDRFQGGRSYSIKYYTNSNDGQILMKYVQVASMGHAWSGGDSTGSYTDPKGPDASLMMVEFFSQFPNSNSTTSTSTSTTSTSATTTTTTSTTGTTGGMDNVIVFRAVPAQSGWVGQITADGYSNTKNRLGDKGM